MFSALSGGATSCKAYVAAVIVVVLACCSRRLRTAPPVSLHVLPTRLLCVMEGQ